MTAVDEIETGVVTRTRPKTKKPSNYKVLMLNDDYTPMEFVVLVLQRFSAWESRTRPGSCSRSTRRASRVRRVHLRSRRDQGQPGHRLRPREPASAAMHAGEGVIAYSGLSRDE